LSLSLSLLLLSLLLLSLLLLLLLLPPPLLLPLLPPPLLLPLPLLPLPPRTRRPPLPGLPPPLPEPLRESMSLLLSVSVYGLCSVALVLELLLLSRLSQSSESPAVLVGDSNLRITRTHDRGRQ
jgi:hypothetical protein